MKFTDISGQRFHSWQVGSYSKDKKRWECICICGNKSFVASRSLRLGISKSCRRCSGLTQMKDLKGKTYGNWLVLRYHSSDKGARWECECQCKYKTIKILSCNDLLNGGAIRCIKCSNKNRINGKNKKLMYVWQGIKQRCNNPKHKHYSRYGGRGIRICDLWKDDYIAFHDWAMANDYVEGFHCDRIDNDGDYCPENCQFIPGNLNAAKVRQDYKIYLRKRQAKKSVPVDTGQLYFSFMSTQGLL